MGLILDDDGVYHKPPVHGWFGLSYSSYLVLQRSLMEAMPLDWQRQMVGLLEAMADEFDTDRIKGSFHVRACVEDGRFVHDPLRDYRHPDRELIESLRRMNRSTADGG